MDFRKLDVVTSAGTFTGEDSTRLARMVLRRWGGDLEGAAQAWRRLLQNSCPDWQFQELVEAKLPEDSWPRRIDDE